jgi:peptidoglycan/xylan/chitin deacetylase (PgdA/CDA1 family)
MVKAILIRLIVPFIVFAFVCICPRLDSDYLVIAASHTLSLAGSGSEGLAAGSPHAPDDRCGPWSEAELKGKTTDKIIVASPHGSRNIPPMRARPTTVNAPLPPRMANSIRSVRLPDGKQLLALTFDLCEAESEISGYDFEVVNYLRENNIKATFFACGKWMRSHPAKTMQLMSDPLFEVGNHGWNHKNFRLLDERNALDQILWTQAQYELLWEQMLQDPCFRQAGRKEVPRVPRVFRFPFGTCNAQALEMLQELGLPAIQWDIVSGDPAKGRSARAIADLVLKKARPGSIIICHANGRGHGTAQSLPMFVPMLRDRGFEFVTVSELLGAGTPVACPQCYESSPGDNSRYDRKRSAPKSM